MKLKLLLPLLASFVVAGCSDSTNFDFDANRAEQAASAEPPALPFPTSLLFAGSEDGTLNIPLGADVDPNDFGNPQVVLNTLDGFSTTQPLTSVFSSPLNAATLIPGETVRVFEVNTDPATGAVVGFVAELPAQAYAAVVVAETTLAVQPLLPLAESTDYMVVVTNGVTDINGAPAVNSVFRLTSGQLPLVPSTTDADGNPLTEEQLAELEPVSSFEALEPVRQLNGAMLQVAEALGIARDTVVQIWSVKTQSITPVLEAVSNASQVGGTIALQSVGITTNGVNPALQGVADVFAGTLDIPYYQTAPANPNDPTAITSFWRGPGDSFLTRFNTMPVQTSLQTIPVLMTVPNAASGQAMPAAGWPVAIFVHGITRDRSDMLALADSMAAAGFAVIAIDQPMHGITVDASVNPLRTEVERTFDLDLVNNESGAPGPDGIVDDSGTHFFSPAQLLNTRDNLRQSVADLLVLSASIGNVSAVPLDANRKALIGYSLGGTAATTAAAFDSTLASVTLAKPAAGLVQMTIASPAFRDPIIAGLAQAGLQEGTPEFSQFVIAAQTATDSADPINFGARAAAMNRVHMIEVVGDAAAGIPPDQVVLNTVPGAPLSGSSALARVMSLPPVSSDTGNSSGIVRFTRGDHGSLINPAASPEATVEMQSQVARFAASAGMLIDITDTSVILDGTEGQ